MGAVEIENRLQAACVVDGTGGTFINSNGFTLIERLGVGDYRLTLEQEIADASAVLQPVIVRAPGFATYAQAASPVSNQILVQTFDGANPPAAADEDFSLNVWQLPRLETP